MDNETVQQQAIESLQQENMRAIREQERQDRERHAE